MTCTAPQWEQTFGEIRVISSSLTKSSVTNHKILLLDIIQTYWLTAGSLTVKIFPNKFFGHPITQSNLYSLFFLSKNCSPNGNKWCYYSDIQVENHNTTNLTLSLRPCYKSMNYWTLLRWKEFPSVMICSLWWDSLDLCIPPQTSLPNIY